MFLVHATWAFLCKQVLLLSIAVFVAGLVIIGLRYPIPALLVVALARWQASRRVPPSDSHGSARLANVLDLARNRMLGNDGLILGRVGWAERPGLMASLRLLLSSLRSDIACGLVWAALFRSRWLSNRMIRIKDYCHLATISRTGGGKGVSVVVPTLRSYRRGSVVTTDPDGQNYGLTAEFRERMGHRVVCLDPNRRCGPKSDSFNVLAFIDRKAPDVLDQCREVANLLIVRDGKQETDSYWNDQAEIVLTAVIAFVVLCAPQEEKHLDTVREILSSREMFGNLVEELRNSENTLLRRLGNQLNWLRDKELNGVMNSVGRHLAWIDSPEVADCLKDNSFDPRELKSSRMSIYLVLPAKRLETLAPLMRLWIGSLLRLASEDGPDESNEVLFILDEVAHIGRIRPLENAVTISRKYGIRLWFIFQTLNQVKSCYGKDADTILSNIGTLQFFAVRCPDTCETLSRWIGDETLRLELPTSGESTSQQSGSAKSGSSISTTRNSGVTTQELGRRLLKAEEIRLLPEDVALVFHRNLPVIPARLLRYYDAPEFGRRGTGKQHGLGLAAGVMATVMLVASVVFVDFAGKLPVPEPRRQPAYRSAAGQAYGPQPWEVGGGSPLPPSSWPYAEPQPYRRTFPPPWSRRRGRVQQSPSGFYDPYRIE